MERPTPAIEIRVGRQGRIVVPAELRARLGLQEGTRLQARVENDELRLSTVAQTMRSIQQRVESFVPGGTDLVAELIAERRRDAKMETT